jgi:eukaryotic-like serine/threonine-protein kinase
VPDIIGQTVPAATLALQKAGFLTIATPTTYGGPCGANPAEAPQTVTEGKVCTQNPAADSKQTKDTRITFTTYKKPTIGLQDYRNQPYAQAAAAISALGLKPVRKDVDNAAAAGTVVDQSPAPYSQVLRGSAVTLSVSTGKVGVPNVVGKKIADAQATLNSAGWGNVQIGDAEQTTDKAKDGTVAAQNPVAGSVFPQTQQITLVPYQFVQPTPTTTSPTPTSPSSPPTTSAPPTKATPSHGG